MKSLQRSISALALALFCALATAQPGPAASAPGSTGMGWGMHHGPRMGPHNTPGWSLMTPAERAEHRDRMRSMHSYDECKAYMDQHHEQMMARAKERGSTLPAQPRRDACAGMKP